MAQSRMPGRRPADFVIIRKIKEQSHPCFNQRGLFARVDIPADTVLCTYGGLVVPKKVCLATDEFCVAVSRANTLYAETCGSEARFANHYGGVATEPNAALVPEVVGERGAARDGVVLLKTLKRVLEGDEILVDYGPEYWRRKKNKVAEADIARGE